MASAARPRCSPRPVWRLAQPAAVAAIFPTFTSPPAEQPAAALKVPGLILTTPGDPTTLNSNALSLSGVWEASTLRIVKKGEAAGLAEGRRLTQVMGLGGPHRGTQKAVRALITGYLLATLAGDKTYRDFADPDVQLPRTVPVDPKRRRSPRKRRSSRC